MQLKRWSLALLLVYWAPTNLRAQDVGWVRTSGAEVGRPFEQAVLLDSGGALILRCIQEQPRRLAVFILPAKGTGASLTGRPEYRRFRYALDGKTPRDTLWSYNDTAVSLGHAGEATSFATALLAARSLTVTLYGRDGRGTALTFDLPEARTSAAAVVNSCSGRVF